MVKPKLSVIVSVYNTEKFVEKCIDSILNQTYENIELLIIDDGSKDKSLQLLQKYKKNKNVILIENKENKGLSYSRNLGMKKATGDYLGFIDSDDYIEPDYYKNLMTSIIREKADVAICDMKFKYMTDNPYEVVVKCNDFNKFNKINIINNGIAASACNKVFKKSIITKYEFAEGKVNEDIAVVIPAIVNANKIAYAKNTYYYYIQRKNSMQNSSFSDKRFDIVVGVDTTLERIKGCQNFDKIKDALIYNQIILLLLYVIPKEENSKRRKEILRKYHELTKKYKIRQNPCYWHFVDIQGKKHKLYYRMMVHFTDKNHIVLANKLIGFYNFYMNLFKPKSVIHKATLDDIKKLAIKNRYKGNKIKISCVIPNYNYARFLYQRVYSILDQTYPIYELIILDDKSTDDSKKVINKINKELSDLINIKVIFNEENSGTPFKQWEKGFEAATGDYVWIAEADDYDNKNFLKKVVKPIKKDNDIYISYANTAFINADGNIIVKSIIPEIDIQETKHWNKSYVNIGLDEILHYSYLNCTIANVSSAIIKNGNYSKFFKMSINYRQAGDWLFYVNIMRYGKIAFTNKALNYYRVHGSNVSSTMNQEKHIKEIRKIHEYYVKEFKLGKRHQNKMQKRIDFLKKAWHLN